MTTADFVPRDLPKLPLATGIGSLPHHNIDAALAFSFALDLPFLPQIPISNPWEFMIAQVLDGMPGITVDREGSVALDLDVWTGRTHAFNEKLLHAFSSMARAEAFEAFEPNSSTSSCWQPFLWELEERGHKFAKIQLAGPLTCQWALRLKDGSTISKHPDVASQIFKLVLARALAMSRRLQAGGIQPVLYLDEPALYGFSMSDARHALGLQELKIVVQALRNENVIVGMHCCSNTDWKTVLGLGLQIVSIDTDLSLNKVLATGDCAANFVRNGGRLSLGIIPTGKHSEHSAPRDFSVKAQFEHLVGVFAQAWPGQDDLTSKALREAIYTPACGLALVTTSDAEFVLASLKDFELFAQQSLRD